MKKLLIALVLGLLLVAALATVASADNGPHGGFTNTTDACASCHRAHTAQSSNGMLLVAQDIWQLCVSCHDGTGAYTNVVDGYYDNTIPGGDPHGKATTVGATTPQGEVGQGTFAGGFINARMAHTWNGRWNYGANVGAGDASAQTTSRHEVEGIDAAGVAGIVYTAGPTVWGSGDISLTDNTGSAITTELECTSCHDPHGSAGRVGGVATGMPTTSYRLLRFNPNGSKGFEVTVAPRSTQFPSAGVSQSAAADLTGDGGVYVADVVTKWYTPNTNATLDPSVQAMRSRWDGTAATQEPFHGYINSDGDYAGRTYNYLFPAVQIGSSYSTSGTPGWTYWSCPDAGNSNNPTGPGTATSTNALGTGVAATHNLTLCAASTNPITGAALAVNAAAGSVWNNSTAMGPMARWCSTCHDRYMNTTRTATTTDSLYHEAHNTVTSVPCAACHVAHGTTATMTTDLARKATFATGSSILLKTDNRSICADCHGTSVNFWNQSNVGTYGTLITPNALP